MISSFFNWATSKIQFLEIEYLCFKLFKNNQEQGLTELEDAVLFLRKKQLGIEVSINLIYNGIEETKPIIIPFKKEFTSITDIPDRLELQLQNEGEVKIRLLDFYQNILLTNGEKVKNPISFRDLQHFLNKEDFDDDSLFEKKLIIKDELFKVSVSVFAKKINTEGVSLKSKRFVFVSITNLPSDVSNQLEEEGKVLISINN